MGRSVDVEGTVEVVVTSVDIGSTVVVVEVEIVVVVVAEVVVAGLVATSGRVGFT